MVMTVVTLSKVPPALRGDLTKWMQEIATGVYVGNFNTRVREQLWERIKQSVGSGEATMSYAHRNELGYQFETHRTHRKNISFDGIPLVMIPKEQEKNDEFLERGYSKAAKFRKAKKYGSKQKVQTTKRYVVIDIETDGLNSKENRIIEIGAVKIVGEEVENFQSLLQYNYDLPEEITKLTGITKNMLLEEGRDSKEVLEGFLEFIEDFPIVGYNLNFDVDFINRYLKLHGKERLTNQKYDLLSYVKKEKMFLSSYKLADVLHSYEIDDKLKHRALDDANLTYKLSTKVNEFAKVLN